MNKPVNFDSQADELEIQADALVDAIRPVLAGVDPEVVGAVLGGLLAILIAGHHPALRKPVLAGIVDLARGLVPIEVEQMIEAGRVGDDWRATQ